MKNKPILNISKDLFYHVYNLINEGKDQNSLDIVINEDYCLWMQYNCETEEDYMLFELIAKAEGDSEGSYSEIIASATIGVDREARDISMREIIDTILYFEKYIYIPIHVLHFNYLADYYIQQAYLWNYLIIDNQSEETFTITKKEWEEKIKNYYMNEYTEHNKANAYSITKIMQCNTQILEQNRTRHVKYKLVHKPEPEPKKIEMEFYEIDYIAWHSDRKGLLHYLGYSAKLYESTEYGEDHAMILKIGNELYWTNEGMEQSLNEYRFDRLTEVDTEKYEIILEDA